MSIKLRGLTELNLNRSRKSPETADSGFSEAVADAINSRGSAYNSIYFNQKSFVAISPKFEKKLQTDPELAEETARKIENLTKLSALCGGDRNSSVIVIDRSGEIKQYHTKPSEREKRLEELEAESLKEAIKARLRKKARTDAYFKLVERNAVKRKLIEQENAKRPRGKRYRYNSAKLNSAIRSIIGSEPATAADILSMLE